MTLKVVEIFPSIQGEGGLIGIPSTFVRLSGCNLKCIFCDTKYSWEEGGRMPEKQILHDVERYGNRLITITGGEPLIQNLEDLLWELHLRKFDVCVETNGTIRPHRQLFEFVDTWSVSPKLSNSGVSNVLRFPVEEASYFKFIICNKKDLDEMVDYCKSYRISLDKVIVQPNGLRNGYIDVLNELVSWVKESKMNIRVLPQLHRLLWGLKRGV